MSQQPKELPDEPTEEAIAAAYDKLSDKEKASIQSLPPNVKRVAMRQLLLSEEERLLEHIQAFESLKEMIKLMPPEILNECKNKDLDWYQEFESMLKTEEKVNQFIASRPQKEQDRLKDVPLLQMAAFIEEWMQEKGFNPNE